MESITYLEEMFPDHEMNDIIKYYKKFNENIEETVDFLLKKTPEKHYLRYIKKYINRKVYKGYNSVSKEEN